MPCAAGISRSRSVLISERRASALYATALNPGRYDFMQKGRSSSEKYPDGAKHPLAAMIGHRLRSEHFEVLTEALPERWVGLLNSIHALPEQTMPSKAMLPLCFSTSRHVSLHRKVDDKLRPRLMSVDAEACTGLR